LRHGMVSGLIISLFAIEEQSHLLSEGSTPFTSFSWQL
jgi:hypothetical protein